MNGQPDPEAFYRAPVGFSTDGPDGWPWSPGAAVYRGDHWAVVKHPQLFELAIPEDVNRRQQAAIIEGLAALAPTALAPTALAPAEAAPDAADPWWTHWRLETAERYRDAIRGLRRTGRPSVAAAASRMALTGDAVDRGTLTEWIRLGKLERPEDVPER